MLLGKRLIAFCIGVQAACVAAASHTPNRTSLADDEGVAYESTVTTDMGYYESESMSGKGRSYHDEYEYVPLPGPKHSKKGKSGKKSGYEHTVEPTEHTSYTVAPTEYSSYKGKKNGEHHQNAKSDDEGDYTENFTENPSFSMEYTMHRSSKGSKSKPRPHVTHAPTHMGTQSSRKGKGDNSSKGSKKGKGGSEMTMDGKGSKRGKGSKSAKGGGYPTPAPQPSPSSSDDYFLTRPPTHVVHPTQSPVAPGSTTASPTDSGSVPFELSPFSLLYETDDKRQATRLELAEVTDVTRLYLEEFMFDELTGSAFTFLDDFVTRMITSTYVSGDSPYVVDYSSIARFNPFSTVFLSEQQLDEALTIAFTGANLDVYTDLLKGLPSGNVFFNAQVSFGAPVVRISQRSGNSNAAGIAAAAVAATLIAAGIVLYRRRQRTEENGSEDVVKKGDRTVAGETYTGDSYDGTGSSNGSLEHGSRYRDEQDEEAARSGRRDGTKAAAESDESLRPRWGATKKSSYDDDDSSEPDSTESRGSKFGPPPSQSFDQMALQGLTTMLDSQGRLKPTKAYDSLNSNGCIDDQSGTQPKRRPRTVEEIEAMLCTDYEDEASIGSRSRGNDSTAASSSSSQRPRTVEEIESLLSEGLDDDLSETSSAKGELE